MTLQEIDAVRLCARSLLKKFNVKDPPVNVLEIAKYLQAKIIFSDELPDDVFGCLLPLKNGKFIIVVNVFTSDTRKIFTVAHEIGHLYLKHYLILDKIYQKQEKLQISVFDKIKSAKAKMERLANIFAAELLMPKHLVKRYYWQLGGDIEKLAETFMVSKEAMEIRIKELKL